MGIGFLFCHGWGFDHSFFTPLGNHLKDLFPNAPMIYKNRKYFSSSSPHQKEKDSAPLSNDHLWIGIGHSLGFSRLLRTPIQGLISINGFTRFCRHPGTNYGTPLRVLDRMMKKLQLDPTEVLTNFYAQCGVSLENKKILPETSPLNVDLLYQDLKELQSLEITEKFLQDKRPSLSLRGQDDTLVSSGLWEETMGSKIGLYTAIFPHESHMLGQSNALWCAQQIEQWIKNEFSTVSHEPKF